LNAFCFRSHLRFRPSRGGNIYRESSAWHASSSAYSPWCASRDSPIFWRCFCAERMDFAYRAKSEACGKGPCYPACSIFWQSIPVLSFRPACACYGRAVPRQAGSASTGSILRYLPEPGTSLSAFTRLMSIHGSWTRPVGDCIVSAVGNDSIH